MGGRNKQRPVRNRKTGKFTYYETSRPPQIEGLTKAEDSIPWYKRTPRGRGGTTPGNAGIVNDTIGNMEDRLERNSQGITGPEDPGKENKG